MWVEMRGQTKGVRVGSGLVALTLFALVGCTGGASGEASSDDPTTEDTAEPMLVTDSDPVADLTVIPVPAEVTLGEGHIVVEGDELPEPEVTVDADLEVEVGEEGYRLDVDEGGIRIAASTDAGAFYAQQTLDQLVVSGEAPGESRIPFVSVVDQPRFEWRGYMLDVARHFFDMDVVKKQIDVLATYKINRLHLHLTDDQGWRIELESRPELTTIGAAIDISGEGPGGFFTTEDYAEIVGYAAARFITVVPEIDVPGHVNAALATYADLNENGETTELKGVVPFGQSALSIDAPGTVDFIADVFTEIAEMTPGEYIHMGGDEVLSRDDDEYRELVTLAFDSIERNGKTAVAWEEAVVAEPPERAIIQYWIDIAKAQRAAAAGSKLIMSPAPSAYLDMKYNELTRIGLNWAGLVDVHTAYDWDPAALGIDESQILGVEAALWTETVSTDDEVDFMTYPRMLGYAEIGWSPQDARNWDDYRVRLGAHGARLTDAGVGFYESELIDWAATDRSGDEPRDDVVSESSP